MKEPTLYKILRPIIAFLFKIIFHPHIIGTENIPKEGRIILAGNHTNILDPLLIMTSTKRTVHFLAKDELIKGPFGFIFRQMGIIPVNRRQKDPNALNASLEVLNNDKVIGIFPEGTINRTRDITIPFKTGVVRMAWQTNSQIIPFSITGKYHILKSGITIKFNKPYFVKTNEKDKEIEILRNIINTMIIERRKSDGSH